MRRGKCWLLILVVLLSIALYSERCLAREQGRFHSEVNGYLIAVPADWIQIPKYIILENFNQLISSESNLKICYETAFQYGTAETWFQYPYVIIQVMTYSNWGLNRQIYACEFKEFVKHLSGLDTIDVSENFSAEAQRTISDIAVGKAYLDSNNRLYQIGLEADVANMGEIKGIIVGHFGRRAIIQVMFYDLKINWSQSKRERDSILGSFEFDPVSAYSETAESRVGFFERRAMEALPMIVLVLIVGGVGAMWGYVSGKIKNYKDRKTTKSGDF
ncbi:MAG: hypothetical protein JW804_01435 [Sedimentisphaerales bacterium]|nr:hypothetical protein [Sedimentisphaerales bacterium]